MPKKIHTHNKKHKHISWTDKARRQIAQDNQRKANIRQAIRKNAYDFVLDTPIIVRIIELSDNPIATSRPLRLVNKKMRKAVMSAQDLCIRYFTFFDLVVYTRPTPELPKAQMSKLQQYFSYAPLPLEKIDIQFCTSRIEEESVKPILLDVSKKRDRNIFPPSAQISLLPIIPHYEDLKQLLDTDVELSPRIIKDLHYKANLGSDGGWDNVAQAIQSFQESQPGIAPKMSLMVRKVSDFLNAQFQGIEDLDIHEVYFTEGGGLNRGNLAAFNAQLGRMKNLTTLNLSKVSFDNTARPTLPASVRSVHLADINAIPIFPENSQCRTLEFSKIFVEEILFTIPDSVECLILHLALGSMILVAKPRCSKIILRPLRESSVLIIPSTVQVVIGNKDIAGTLKFRKDTQLLVLEINGQTYDRAQIEAALAGNTSIPNVSFI